MRRIGRRGVEAESAKRHRAKLRKGILQAYGNEGKCCREAEPLFLEIDHKYGGGGKHRKRIAR